MKLVAVIRAVAHFNTTKGGVETCAGLERMNLMQTFNQLKWRALKHHNLLLRKYRGEDAYLLVDGDAGYLASYPEKLSLEEIEEWLDDLDKINAEADKPE
ncbi:MAG: hypothetical protein IJP68_01105 [Selenomonadaceae bacterium]|nr:hypothetical protein [Selenomonadaceae bacterium]